MPYTLNFMAIHDYDTRDVGIDIPVVLRFGSDTVGLKAKIDTGSSLCIFERLYAKKLGLDIESGSHQRISTVTGSFLAYGHEVTLSVLGIETSAVVYFAEDENFSRNVLGRQG
ncbi:MAG: hypothetical protein L0229_23220, partial [Blastocatellia bacterium]|nr:hypothetical protein [Blastocatellia bacterium]